MKKKGNPNFKPLAFNPFEAGFISTAITDEMIDKTLESAKRVMQTLEG